MLKNNMKQCKDLLYRHLCDIYGSVDQERKYSWCTSHSTIGKYENIIHAISSFRNVENFLPERVTSLPCDYAIEAQKLIIEYDEIQHFTEQRRLSLKAYPADAKINYNKEIWINLCQKYRRKMNKKADPYRDEKRALYDSIRDLIIPLHGYKLIRIYHGQIDFENPSARKMLMQILNK